MIVDEISLKMLFLQLQKIGMAQDKEGYLTEGRNIDMDITKGNLRKREKKCLITSVHTTRIDTVLSIHEYTSH